MAQAQWTTQSFSPKKLLLVPQNPRIEVEENPTQEQIPVKMLVLEEVLDLARAFG
ncbi:hypothetical protein ACFWXM_30360 [Achromobacter xylosoxidans]|uniref:hypothetical protein n=1 Tax=Alcaligenes xylosoxydans xylosoxydans TaxID=85698 RepID=UPI003761E95C